MAYSRLFLPLTHTTNEYYQFQTSTYALRAFVNNINYRLYCAPQTPLMYTRMSVCCDVIDGLSGLVTPSDVRNDFVNGAPTGYIDALFEAQLKSDYCTNNKCLFQVILQADICCQILRTSPMNTITYV